MYYRLNEDYALRAWKFVNHGLYHRYSPDWLRVDAQSYELLMASDGEHDLPESEALRRLVERGMIAPCEKGEHPSDWSRFRRYEHRFVPGMNLMLTGKCNYNCRHCFNAAENADRMAEWDYEEVLDLLDQAEECGFHSISLTGGEPMLHPRFADVVRAIYARNMVLDRLATNGYFLREETLELFRELRARPRIKISFDGVGCHDWMRGRKGAEEDALRALRLCADNGFLTLTQTQVNRANLASLRDTLSLLDEIGVRATRLIRTIPLPRWMKNEPDGSLSTEEYLESMLDLAAWYLGSGHKMDLVIWRYLTLYPINGTYRMVMDQSPEGRYRPTAPVCSGNRMMMAVTCEGYTYPCMQMSGYLSQRGVGFDNLHERRLADILRESAWLDAVCKNHYWLREHSKNCGSCPWFGHCGGGCRALGILDASETTGEYDYSASDPLACLFFKGGWYEKVRERLSEYRCS